MRKYVESKTTRIMMATVPHVISGLGLRKFQADGFLLSRVYCLCTVIVPPVEANTPVLLYEFSYRIYLDVYLWLLHEVPLKYFSTETLCLHVPFIRLCFIADVLGTDAFVTRTFNDFRILMDRQVFPSELRNALIGLKCHKRNGSV